jgi:hypothetical protein
MNGRLQSISDLVILEEKMDFDWAYLAWIIYQMVQKRTKTMVKMDSQMYLNGSLN